MNALKSLILAAALALPVAAQAAPLIEGGTNNDIFPGQIYSYDETLDLAAGLNTFTFALTPWGTPGNALTTNIAIEAVNVVFGDFSITGPGGPFGYTQILPGPNGFIAFINDAPWIVGQAYDLNLSFTLAQAAEALVNVQVNAVPLPAAGLLLLGSIGGLGALARRRQMAA